MQELQTFQPAINYNSGVGLAEPPTFILPGQPSNFPVPAFSFEPPEVSPAPPKEPPGPVWLRSLNRLELANLAGVVKQSGNSLQFEPVSAKLSPWTYQLILTGQPKLATLFTHILLGLVRPTQGRVVINRRDLGRLTQADLIYWRQQQIGLVPPTPAFLEIFSLHENLRLALDWTGEAVPTQAETRLAALLEMAGLTGRSACLPTELSQPELRLAALVKALVKAPRLLIVDSAAFEETAEASWKLLEWFHRRGGIIFQTASFEQYQSWQKNLYLPANAQVLELKAPY
jgi:ABC-type ATPase involved in cell division